MLEKQIELREYKLFFVYLLFVFKFYFILTPQNR